MGGRRQIVKVILLTLVVYLAWVLGRGLWDLYRARGRLTEARQELIETRVEQEKLAERLEEIKSDEFKEKEVRDKLMRQLPGETVVVVPEVELMEKRTGGKGEEGKANWRKWRDLFFGE